jgi:hypothetical protein
MSKNTQLGNLVNGIFVDSTGRVGVGTQTPTYLLEVATASGSQRIRVGTLQNNSNSSTFEAITTAASTTASSGWFRANAGGTMSIGTSTYAKANSDSGNFANLSSEAQTVAMTIASSGSVGIGTASPSYSLEVKKTGSDSTIWGYNIAQLADSTSNATGFRVGTSTSVSGLTNLVAATNNDASQFAFWTYNGSAWGERMRILANGNVAIGNTSPSTKLHVTGTITSTDIIMSGIGSWSYTTNSSWTSYQVGIPFNALSGGGVYLIRLQWGGDAPYIAYGSFLWMPVQSNGGSSDNEMAVMVSTHQGGGGLIFVRNGAVGGQASSQLLIRLANFAQYVGNLTVTAARLM